MSIVLISLGSNLGERLKSIYQASALIAEKIGRVITQSPVYESKAWGVLSPNDYLNSCLLVETTLSPEQTMIEIQDIEQRLGRIRKARYGDRTIDIDILLYDQEVIDTEQLSIPHPRMEHRLFVLVPANQIVPAYEHPILKKSIQQLLLDCTDESNVYEYKISEAE